MADKTSKPGKVLDVIMPHFVEEAIREYGRYVLEERAVPVDVDGLKPSHRRLLVSLKDLKVFPNGNYRKAMAVLGHCTGTYHPHGDAGLYDAMKTLVWLRYPLVDGHGNWGSPQLLDKEAAAPRYTECRMTPLAKDVLDDFEVIPTVPNYDGTTKEPVVLPARVPLLLCNGTYGIAVAVAGSIPPSNIREVISACKVLIKNPDAKPKKVVKHLLGPDHREGGIITSERSEIAKMYRAGKGQIRYRCHYSFEQDKKTTVLVVKSLAPGFNPESFEKKCAKLKENGIIEFCDNETDGKRGVRIVVGFKTPQAIQKHVLPLLNTSLTYNFYAIRQNWDTDKKNGGDKEFRQCNAVSILKSWIVQRKEIEKRLLEAEKAGVLKEKERCEARLFATRNIDDIIKIFKDKRNDTPIIIEKLMKLGMNKAQAEYICELRLIQIRRFSEKEQLEQIKRLEDILARIERDLADLNGVLLRRLKDMEKKYGDERMTVLEGAEGGEGTELKMRTKSRFVIISKDAGFKGSDEIPLKRSCYPNRKSAQAGDVFITKGAEEVTLILRDGSAIQTPIYTQDGMLEFEKNEEAEGNEVVGVATEKHKKVLMIDDDGVALAIENPQNASDYIASNSELYTNFAAGLNSKDKFFIINEHGNSYWNTGKSLVTRRRGSKGKRFERLSAVVEFYVVREGQDIWDSAGNKADPFRVEPGTVFKFKHGRSKLYVISEKSNVVLLKSGVFKALNRRQVIPLLRKGEIVKIWPME